MIKGILQAAKKIKAGFSLQSDVHSNDTSQNDVSQNNKPNITTSNINEVREFYSFNKLKNPPYHQDILNHPEKYIIRHLEEIVSVGYNFPNYLKYAQLAMYINHFKIKTMVETGTLVGSCCDFFKDTLQQIYTIDIDPSCYHAAREKFKDYPNIIPVLGDSAVMLPEVLQKLHERTLFFLDGHYHVINDDDESIPGYSTLKSSIGETPIVQELEAIAKHPIKDHVIIIDDCGCFDNSDHKDYPSVEVMKLLCQKLFPAHIFIAKYGSIYLTTEEVHLYREM